MNLSTYLDQLHLQARKNKWLGYFAVFNRVVLALGFLPSGMTKILGERFTDLSINHPMGHYLEALHYTGYYYTTIGIMQVLAAVLLLIPRTALLGAIIYFPIILNICILSLAVRFDGSLVSAPLMVLANLYLFCWDYHKLKFIFPFNQSSPDIGLPEKNNLSNKFPMKFFAGVFATVLVVGITLTNVYTIVPHNTLPDCVRQCPDNVNSTACLSFCDCIHKDGETLKVCLEKYKKAVPNEKETAID